jgi:biotin carboxyl carrier protein
MQAEVEIDGRIRQVTVRRSGALFVVTVDGREHTVDAEWIDGHTLSLLMRDPGANGRIGSRDVTLAVDGATKQLVVRVGAAPIVVAVNGRRRAGRKDDGARAGGPQRLVAPMPGKVLRVLVSRGDAVQARQPLVVIEAMKMENELRATAAGVVAELHAHEGQSVDAGALLAVVAPA